MAGRTVKGVGDRRAKEFWVVGDRRGEGLAKEQASAGGGKGGGLSP